ncbi:MAG: hypothetical protein L0H53_14625 [Candidatus Nitrosocosmicus sp.]|nr:hypothetical protein [Candidatus Nitrosocosmicus sp.]MDN5868634.1 hypothetical protein [Candidatus Nitrosocosmicus sp.]
MNRRETILITGAIGTLRSEVIRQFSRDSLDTNVKKAIHSVENSNKVLHPKVSIVPIDYDNK